MNLLTNETFYVGESVGMLYHICTRTKAAIILGLLICTTPLVGQADPTENRVGIPSAGSLLNELEPERHITPRPKQPKIDMNVPQQEEAQVAATVYVRKVIFDSPDLDVNDKFQYLTVGKIKKEMSFKEMQQLAVDTTNVLRKDGYMTALAYVPVQDVQHGILHIKIMIGRYGDISIKNTSQLTDKAVLGFLYPMKPGRLIDAKQLNKSLLVLNDIPGVIAKADLAPGTKRGTAKLNINVETLEKQGAYVFVDNYGSKSTGEWRYGLDYHYNNVSHVGDQIDVSILDSFKGIVNYQGRYGIPVGRDGANLRFVASHMNYDLGDRWSYMDSNGIANTYEIGVTVPMKRTLHESSFYDIAVRNRALSDSWFGHVLESKKTSNVIAAEIHGYGRDRNDSISYSIAHTLGHLRLDTPYARNTDLLEKAGDFQKSNASFYYIHQFDNRWQLHFSGSAQLGWSNLDSSENFYIGGANGVRAFPQGEVGGNSGILGTLEARYMTKIPGLQLTAFIDAGRIKYDRYYLDTDTSDKLRNLAGVGLGFIYSKSRDWYAKFDWATPWGPNYSIAKDKKIHNTLWLRVVKQF